MDNEAKIAEFCDLTGVPKKQAEEILKQYNWNKEEAVEAFFAGADEEEDYGMEADEPPPRYQESKGAASQPGAAGKSSKDKASMLDVWDEEKKKKTGKDGQYFYVGGEHSGEVVIGPDRQKSSDMVKRLFEAAKEHGAEPVPPEEEEERDRKPRLKPFVGSGSRLGASGETSSSASATATATAHSEETNSPGKKPPRNFRLRMWENGFTIDDGELRSYSDENSQQFLRAITNGRIPEELLRTAAGAEVHVDLEDRRSDEYTPPAQPKIVAFSGHGNRLGSVVPGFTTDAPSSKPAPPVASSAASSASKPGPAAAEVQMNVDDSQPTTTIQIRLADGSRLVTRANHSHTISQLRDYIRRARPQLAHSFILTTMFPNRELTDESQTLAAAGLLNAAIIQRASKVA